MFFVIIIIITIIIIIIKSNKYKHSKTKFRLYILQFRQQHWIHQIFSSTYCRLFSCCVSAVPLGSIEELPGKSCVEIKASEGKAMTYGKHWIYSDENLDQAIQATCDGNSLSLYQVYIEISQLI